MSFETFWSITGNWLSNFCFQVACMLKTFAQICEIASTNNQSITNSIRCKSHQETVSLHVMQLKIFGSHLTCKIANKCLNVGKRMEKVERKKDNRLFP